jgi:hypothetical protein
VHQALRIIVAMSTIRIRPGQRRWLWLVPAVPAVLAAALAGWVLWPRPAAAPQARQYLDVTACLLTGPGGVTPGAPAAPTWAAMEKASLTTHVMVSYLPATAPDEIPVLLNTMVQRRCGVIITDGAPPGQVASAARANPRQRFLLVGSADAAAVPANAAVVSTASAPARIDQALRALVAAA